MELSREERLGPGVRPTRAPAHPPARHPPALAHVPSHPRPPLPRPPTSAARRPPLLTAARRAASDGRTSALPPPRTGPGPPGGVPGAAAGAPGGVRQRRLRHAPEARSRPRLCLFLPLPPCDAPIARSAQQPLVGRRLTPRPPARPRATQVYGQHSAGGGADDHEEDGRCVSGAGETEAAPMRLPRGRRSVLGAAKPR